MRNQATFDGVPQGRKQFAHGIANLAREGVDPGRVHFVGNTMIDALLAHRERFAQAAPLGELGLTPGGYACVTFHRPSNVDGEASLTRLCGLLRALAARLPVVFPVHPRTRARLEALGLRATLAGTAGLTLTEPLDYLSFMGLVAQARLAMTDSGGIQEETSVLGVPCLTLRTTTERPLTVTEGTNRLVPPGDPAAALAAVDDVLARPRPAPAAIELWDGKAAGRIVDVLARYLGARYLGAPPAAASGT